MKAHLSLTKKWSPSANVEITGKDNSDEGSNAYKEMLAKLQWEHVSWLLRLCLCSCAGASCHFKGHFYFSLWLQSPVAYLCTYCGLDFVPRTSESQGFRKAAPEVGSEPVLCSMGNLACTCSPRDEWASAFSTGPAETNWVLDTTRQADGPVLISVSTYLNKMWPHQWKRAEWGLKVRSTFGCPCCTSLWTQSSWRAACMLCTT